MLCYLQQITLRLAAKRKAKCSKMQGEKQQNARRNDAKYAEKWHKTQGEMHKLAYSVLLL